MSLVTNSRTPEGARDQVGFQETAANCVRAGFYKQTIFWNLFFYVLVGRSSRKLNDWPLGKQ